MRTVIDATTPVVKKALLEGTRKAVEKLTEKGVKRTIEVAIDKVPRATRRTIRGVKTVAEVAKETNRELRARRNVKSIDVPEVEVKSTDE